MPIAIMRASERGLSIYDPSSIGGLSKMLDEVLRQFGFETAEAQASVRLKPEYTGDDMPRFWYFESVNKAKEDEMRLISVSAWASSYEQAVTLLYVTYCWE